MSTVAAEGKFAWWSVVGSAAVAVAAVELLVAVDLLATASFGAWQNWTAGAIYIVLASVIVARAAARRSSLPRSVVELLALDLLALPVAIAAMAM
jgi:uncharacterized membrane protein SirB2